MIIILPWLDNDDTDYNDGIEDNNDNDDHNADKFYLDRSPEWFSGLSEIVEELPVPPETQPPGPC